MSGGKPTAIGQTFLNAASTNDLTSVDELLAAGAASLEAQGEGVLSYEVATNAQPVQRVAGRLKRTTVVRRTTHGSRNRQPASASAVAGSNSWTCDCWPSQSAHLVWYCKQGASACRATAYYGLGPSDTKSAGGCSVVNRAPCQIYTIAVSHAPDWVAFMTVTQVGVSGAPTLGDKWCG